MRLYAGLSSDFIELNKWNQLSGILEEEFFQQIGDKPSHNEVMSWQRSLLRLCRS